MEECFSIALAPTKNAAEIKTKVNVPIIISDPKKVLKKASNLKNVAAHLF